MDTKHIVPKTVVVVKRRWHNPDIVSFIDNHDVGSQMELTDFLRALVDEVFDGRSRLLMLSKDEALSKVLSASSEIQNEMKQATIHVV